MPINNQLYETYGDGWWAEDAGFDFSSLRYCVNPVRYGYFKRTLRHRHPSGKTVLDVGCGGGFLAEEFARDGFKVTGIDPASRSVEAARKHAAENNLAIDYRVGRGEAIPFPDSSFDVIACCDVLEHVDDLNQVIHEVARTMKPGGLFLYDTVNRTWLSKLVLIKIWQDWALTRCLPPNAHVWEKFIRPTELIAVMNDCNLANQEMKGISARRKNPFAVLWNLRAIRTGRIGGEKVAAAFELCESEDLSISYMGYALRQ
jgi:2-polyprenyl-6-hydroxyphenyl methylase / 3-demethylubiquinone-9 3-methyltransferase